MNPVALWALTHILPFQVHVGTATTFDVPERDPWNNLGFACEGRTKLTKLQSLLVASGAIVAHKVLPCGTIALICAPRLARCALGVVWDRGPRRALFDLWHDLSELLKANGKEAVIAITWGGVN